MINRVITIVLDGFGVGESPDAKVYGDEGSNTLKGIYENAKLDLPNMKKLGLYNIEGIGIENQAENPIGAYGKAQEKSVGKNSPVGHWEMSGYITNPGFKTYPQAFPKEMIEEFIEKTGVKGILCNEVGSGTEILKRFGEEHIKTGYPIIYTSADSVFQIAAHEDVIPVEKLYEICKITRKMLDKKEYNVGTVIARPFVGTCAKDFTRTYNRKDFESNTFGKTMLSENGKQVISIGKIGDLFSERGITKSIHTNGNADGIEKTIEKIKENTEGLIYTNLVDFDMLYGHRNNIEGYAKALEYFDSKLPEIMENMKETDMLIITADHGNDPSTPSTDHSREYIPIIIYGKQIKANTNIGTRKTYADIGATILDILQMPLLETGESFKNEILDGIEDVKERDLVEKEKEGNGKMDIKEMRKQEKGAISTLVLFTVLMFVTILMSVFIIVGVRQKSGLKSSQRVAEVYEEDVDRSDEVYNEVISKGTGNEELEKLKEELAQANATEDKILKDYKAYANGKLLTGTMANREATTDAVSVAASGDYAYIRIPQGGYLTNASSGYPEIKASIADINNATGYKYTQSQYDESYNNGYNAGKTGVTFTKLTKVSGSYDTNQHKTTYSTGITGKTLWKDIFVVPMLIPASGNANNNLYNGTSITYDASNGRVVIDATWTKGITIDVYYLAE